MQETAESFRNRANQLLKKRASRVQVEHKVWTALAPLRAVQFVNDASSLPRDRTLETDGVNRL